MSTVEKSMGRTVDITALPNHINNEHVHIFRWLDGCGWTIKCGNIHIESSNIEDAIMDFLKFTSELDMSIEDMDYLEITFLRTLIYGLSQLVRNSGN